MRSFLRGPSLPQVSPWKPKDYCLGYSNAKDAHPNRSQWEAIMTSKTTTIFHAESGLIWRHLRFQYPSVSNQCLPRKMHYMSIVAKGNPVSHIGIYRDCLSARFKRIPTIAIHAHASTARPAVRFYPLRPSQSGFLMPHSLIWHCLKT